VATKRARALEPAGCEEGDLNNARACNSGIGHFWWFTGIVVDGLLKEGGGGVETRAAALTSERATTLEAWRWMGPSTLTQKHRRLLPPACLRAFRLGLPFAPVAKADATMICRLAQPSLPSLALRLTSLATRSQTNTFPFLLYCLFAS
jgi:hypothetical protein